MSTTPGFTQKLARKIVETEDIALPQYLYEHAKVAFMDWVSVSIAAMNEPLISKLIRHTEAMGGHQQSSLLGHRKRVNVKQAALINGTMSHALDFDDSLGFFLGHPSVVLFPCLLALAEWRKLSGRRLLTAYLTGLHAGSWIGKCAGLSHYQLGWHGTSTIGRQGAAAAASKLLELDEQQTIYALGIAGTQAGGVKQVFGSMCKPLHAGLAAEGGISAALLAEDGFDSAQDIYEGSLGFFKTFRGDPNAVEADFLRDTHPVEMLTQKYHPSCHATHGPIDIMLDLSKEMNINADDITDISVYCSKIALQNANKTEVSTGLEGKFSFAYSIANALIRKNTGTVAYTDEMVQDPEVQNLMKRIKVEVDDTYGGKTVLRTTCVITLTNGEVITRTSDPNEQNHDLSFKQDKIAAKFINLCSPVFGNEQTEQLKQHIGELDNSTNLEPLLLLTQLKG